MIGMLRGRIIQRQPPFLLIDVNGVGYEVEAPMSTFYALPEGQAEVTLHTHLAVREDAHILYGFAREGDRALFRALLKVSGVGGKMALAILSGMTADEFALCVQAGDVAALTRLPGVGKKTAERLVVEMRDRLEGLSGNAAPLKMSAAPAASAMPADASADAVSALIALGYKPADASRMVRAVAGEGLGTEALIKAALQAAAKK
jgi:Holliday junction DNA helicase RuvA